MKWFAISVVIAALALLTVPKGVEAAVNYFNERRTIYKSESFDIRPDQSPIAKVSCPKGWKATGGGFRLMTNKQSEVLASYPDSSNNRTWLIYATYVDNSGYVHPFFPSRWVVCVR